MVALHNIKVNLILRIYLNMKKTSVWKRSGIVFALGHGKGACDGIGGTVKRHAYKASLQSVTERPINSAKTFAEWAKTAFKNVDFAYCTKAEYTSTRKRLKSRYSNATAITLY